MMQALSNTSPQLAPGIVPGRVDGGRQGGKKANLFLTSGSGQSRSQIWSFPLWALSGQWPRWQPGLCWGRHNASIAATWWWLYLSKKAFSVQEILLPEYMRDTLIHLLLFAPRYSESLCPRPCLASIKYMELLPLPLSFIKLKAVKRNGESFEEFVRKLWK